MKSITVAALPPNVPSTRSGCRAAKFTRPKPSSCSLSPSAALKSSTQSAASPFLKLKVSAPAPPKRKSRSRPSHGGIWCWCWAGFISTAPNAPTARILGLLVGEKASLSSLGLAGDEILGHFRGGLRVLEAHLRIINRGAVVHLDTKGDRV